jgi:hypothetical protein
VADAATIYEKAGAMCSPAQNVDVVPMKEPEGGDVVAVNVAPSIHQVVASPGGQKGGPLWRFPIRRGSQTDDIAPEDLAMYMNQRVRRNYLMLASIPRDARARANFYFPRVVHAVTGVTDTCLRDLRIEDVPNQRNFLVVGEGQLTCRIPIADVLDVWEEREGLWAVKISGTLDANVAIGANAYLRYQPRF